MISKPKGYSVANVARMVSSTLLVVSRNSDPVSSDLAEDEIKEARPSIATQILPYLVKNPGYTARELEEITGIDYHQLHKRLPDLKNAGFAKHGDIRKCSLSGRKCITWYASVNVV